METWPASDSQAMLTTQLQLCTRKLTCKYKYKFSAIIKVPTWITKYLHCSLHPFLEWNRLFAKHVTFATFVKLFILAQNICSLQ